MSRENSRYMTVIKETDDGQKIMECIDLDEVDFIESHNSKIIFHIGDQIYYQITSISEMQELLEGFIPLDRPNLVNLLRIKSFDEEYGKVYFEENPNPKSSFATVAKMKYQLVTTIIKRCISHNNGTTMEIKSNKEAKGLKGIFGVFKS